MNDKYDINLEKDNSCKSACCGGHSHGEHEHGGCCGGHNHGEHNHGCCCGEHKEIDKENLTEDETAFLNHLISYTFLPVTRFILKSSKEKDFLVPCFAPVYIEYKDDNIEKVKLVASILTSLEEKGIISIDYDIELKNYDYSEYYDSDFFKYFQATVEEGKSKKGFLGDIAEIETGSIALSEDFA